jgi:hypothetical protein
MLVQEIEVSRGLGRFLSCGLAMLESAKEIAAHVVSGIIASALAMFKIWCTEYPMLNKYTTFKLYVLFSI